MNYGDAIVYDDGLIRVEFWMTNNWYVQVYDYLKQTTETLEVPIGAYKKFAHIIRSLSPNE